MPSGDAEHGCAKSCEGGELKSVVAGLADLDCTVALFGDAPSSEQDNTGAIVGGTVGGLSVIVLPFIVLFIRRRNQKALLA